jgi:phosphoribosylanthranilate isomerase
MVKVKICGITNLRDARLAVSYGTDFLGFIFANSPRRIDIDKLKEININLSEEVKKVGVFANQSLGEVKEIAKEGNLDYLQLHGDEPPAYCQEFDLPVIKAFSVKDKDFLDELKEYQVDKYLLDAYHPQKLGGIGKTFNWKLAKETKKYGEVIIAGGLNDQNVSKAIKTVHPYGVDVSSGVEFEVRLKDKEKMQKFIKKAKGAEK